MAVSQSSFNRVAYTTAELNKHASRQATVVLILLVVTFFLGVGLGSKLREYQLTHAPSPLVTLEGQVYRLEKVE